LKIQRLFILLLLFHSYASLKSQEFGNLAAWSGDIAKKNDEVFGIENSGLLCGPEYKLPFRGETTHPFFESQAGALSVICFKNNGACYNAPLIYDLYQKQIVVKYLRDDGLINLIQLDPQMIESLKIFNHNFRNFSVGGTPELYDVLFEKDKSILLVKRAKVVEIESPSKVEFIIADEFVWGENGKWFRLLRASDFLQLASKRNIEREFNLFLKGQKVKLRKLSEQDILKIALFYSQIRP
jgi:hypothetical protein